MITFSQVFAHMVGDYLLQSDWMAAEKTKKSVAALAHVVTYTIPFLFVTQSWKALLAIAGTHFLIDRFRLARYVVYVKNFLSPRRTQDGIAWKEWWYRWEDCSGTGYHKDRPVWLATWLLIIADNVLHVGINSLAVRYL